MTKKRRKKPKSSWLGRIKRRLLAFIFPKKTVVEKQPSKKRRRRRKRKLQPQVFSFSEISNSFVLWLKPPRRRRRSKQKSWTKRIARNWLKLAQNVAHSNQKLFAPKKRRRKRRTKQYAVYMLSNQKKVD